MLDDGRKHQCGNEAELVSYLYGECDESQSAKFEIHLATCASCSSELASFTATRAAFDELRSEAVATAPRLAIDLAIQERSSGWLKSLVALFGGARGFAAAGAFGVILIATVTVFIVNRGSNQGGSEIASNTRKTESSATQTPSAAPTAAAPVEEPGKNRVAPKDAPVVQAPPKADPVVRDGAAPKRPQPRNQKVTEKTPTLSNYDEDEDKSLRLADIFDDIGE